MDFSYSDLYWEQNWHLLICIQLIYNHFWMRDNKRVFSSTEYANASDFESKTNFFEVAT